MQRPKPSDTEEDLLKLQSEFLKTGQSTTSVRYPDKRKHQEKDVESKTKRDVVEMEGIESSHPTPSKKTKVTCKKSMPNTDDDNEDIEEIFERKNTGLAAVLTNIIERDTQNQMVSAPFITKQAFPSVLYNDSIVKISQFQPTVSGVPKKKKSLFAQHVEAKSAKEFGVNVPVKPNRILDSVSLQEKHVSSGPHIIDGKGLSASNSTNEALKIHEENLDRLRSMTQAEILEEQQKLTQTIDQKLLNFLKQKRHTGNTQTMSEGKIPSTSFSVLKTKKKNIQSEKLPSIPIKPEKNWVNMDVIERDKMEWMGDLPPLPSLSSETGKPARFDFNGDLLAVDKDIPVHEGLHHHGAEPERAGYTLQELFILARSSNLQQRILSLHTVAKIIRRAKCGELTGKTEGSLLPVLLEGGLVLLLRWALDDSVEGVVYAAVDALHALLWNSLDEDAIDFHWSIFLGHLGRVLTPNQTLEKWAEPDDLDEENKEEETDAEMIKRDVIEALVRRTQLLNRFNYILESMRPQALVVVQQLSILCRVAQHSSNMAYEIVKCSGLMDKIVREFLPTAWSVQDSSQPISDVFGLPVACALRLLRCLSQTGRNLAASLIAKYNLTSVMLRYLVIDKRNLQLPILEAVNLQKEAMALWSVFVAYGFCTQTFFDLYEDIIQKIGKIGNDWDSRKHENELSEQTNLVSLVCVLEKIVCAVQGSKPMKDPGLHCMPVNWSHVTSLFQPIRSFVTRALEAVGSLYPAKKQDLSLPTSCLNFLGSFYDFETKQSDNEPVSRLEELESLSIECLEPFLSSYGLRVLLEHLGIYSNVLSPTWEPSLEVTSNLPSLNVSYGLNGNLTETKEDMELTIPSLRPHSPYPFLVALFRLILSVCKRNKSLISKLLAPMVDKPDLLSYFKKVCESEISGLGSSLWTRSENFLHYLWLKFCCLKPCSDMTLAHRVALRLLSRLSKGDEYLVHDLMTCVIFSPMFIVEGQEKQLTLEGLSSLSLSESLYLKSATQEDINVSKSQLLKEAQTSLAAIRGHFLLALSGMEREVTESRNVYSGNAEGVNHQLLSCDGEGLMPQDWIYLPLIHVYNKATQLKSTPGSEITSKDIAMVTSVLQWNYLMEIWRPKELESVSLATRLSRVMCAFIAGNDMFLNKGVQKYLAGLLREMANNKHFEQMNLEQPIPGISSFYDLYQEFVEHYESVSFGDPVFGLYLLLPLQQQHKVLYRKTVWGEKRKILRSLRVTLPQMLIPVKYMLYPEETDIDLLNLYTQALLSSSIQPDCSPVLYMVAVHHVNRFLFISYDDGNISARNQLWKVVMKNQEKCNVIVFFKQFDPSSQDGIECYDLLPSNRQDVFNKHLNSIK